MRVGILLLAVFLLTAGSGKRPAEVESHFKNPSFDKEKIPAETEPEVDYGMAKKAWETASQINNPPCESHEAWIVRNPENLRNTAFKNADNLPVKGTFDRSVVWLVRDRKEGKAKGGGFIDLSSYQTGNEARDRRVQRYVFDVEQAGTPPTSEFHFEAKEWPGEGTWKTELVTEIGLRGNPLRVTFPVEVTVGKDRSVRIVTTADARFTYANEAFRAGILKMMELCNHGSIASFAESGFDLTLKPQCKS